VSRLHPDVILRPETAGREPALSEVEGDLTWANSIDTADGSALASRISGKTAPKLTGAVKINRMASSPNAPDSNTPNPPVPEPPSFGTKHFLFVLLLALLFFLLGHSMVSHRFFQGGRVHRNGSVGQ
jgi:hypothetical protein